MGVAGPKDNYYRGTPPTTLPSSIIFFRVLRVLVVTLLAWLPVVQSVL